MRRQVGLRVHAALAQRQHRGVAVHARRELHDVHEPAAPVAVRVRRTGARAPPPRRAPRSRARPRGRARASISSRCSSCAEPERAGEVVEAVVEAEPVVVEPAHVGRAALVALGVDPALRLGVRSQHRSSLARGELLVRVEGEHGEVAASAHRRAVGVHGAERLAGVLHDPERRARAPCARAPACLPDSRRCAPAAARWCARPPRLAAASGSMFSVRGSMSQNTGRAPS